MGTTTQKAMRFKGMATKNRDVNGEKNLNSRRRNVGSQMPPAGMKNPLKGPGV